jgi:hypothetical protein
MAALMPVGLEFIFDVGRAVTGSKKLAAGMDAIDMAVQKTEKTSGRIAQTFGSMAGKIGGAAKSAAGFAASFLGLDSAGAVLSKMTDMMPFIGEGFRVIGNVISRNLLWPLTQKLLPIFEQVLNWVRENRVNFVRMGGVLVSVFNMVHGVARGLIRLLRTGFESLWTAIAGGARLTLERFTKFINFALLKITFFIQYILITIEPLIAAIGSLLGAVWKNAVLPFIEGFSEGFGSLSAPIRSIIGLLTDLANDVRSLFGVESAGIFKLLGNLIGTQLKQSIEFVIGAARFLYDAFRALVGGAIDGFREVMGDKNSGLEGIKEIFGIIVKIVGFLFNNLFKPMFKLLIPGFRIVGRIIGVVVGGALRLILGLIKGIGQAFRFFTDLVQKAARFMRLLRSESGRQAQQERRQQERREFEARFQEENRRRRLRRQAPLTREQFRRIGRGVEGEIEESTTRFGPAPVMVGQLDRSPFAGMQRVIYEDHSKIEVTINGAQNQELAMRQLAERIEGEKQNRLRHLNASRGILS